MTDTRVLAVVVVAVLPACLDATPPDDVGSTTTEAFLPSVWTNPSGVSFTGARNNGLTKTAASGWNAGAASVQTLAGPGFVRFTTAENDKAKVLGLSAVNPPSNGDFDHGRVDIDYGILLNDTNQQVSIWENAVVNAGVTTYAPGDVFYIEATPTQIKYRKGSLTSAPLATKTIATGVPFPLQVDTSLHATGATIRDVAIQGFWTKPFGVSVSPTNNLTKTGSIGWNAGAASWDTISGHGYVSFTTAEKNKGKMLGLSRVSAGDADWGRGDIDYGIVLQDDGKVAIWEGGGIAQANVTTYLANDVFYIEASPTHITYRKGAITNPPLRPPTAITNDGGFFPLQVDTSLYTTGATINSVVINVAPVVHVAAQNHFLDSAVNLRCGVNDVISVGGAHFLQIDTMEPTRPQTIHDFSLTTPQQVETELIQWAGQQNIDRYTSATIIMDIENPHPKDLWGEKVGDECVDRSSTEKTEIIDGYKKRIVGARRAFPNAKLGLYGTLNPQSRGNANLCGYQKRVAALAAAGQQGLFDDIRDPPVTGPLFHGLDYLIPVLYIPFGCDGDPPALCDSGWPDIDDFTLLGISGSRMLKKQDGVTTLPLLPLLGFWVENNEDNILFDDRLLLDLALSSDLDPFPGSLRLQMDLFKQAVPPVTDVVLWKGGCTDYVVRDGDDTNNNCGGTSTVNVDDYTCWL